MRSTTSFIAAIALAFSLALAPTPSWSADQDGAWEKVVFHVDDSRYARWILMLARSYTEDAPKARIVLVAYGPGVDFLLEDANDKRGNPYDPAIVALAEKGVKFRVCGTTLRERKIAREDVLDVVEVVPSGVTEIVRLQIKEGYGYLKP